MRIEEEYAATTARPQQSCQGRVEESTRSRSVRSLWPGALIPSESTNDKKQVQTNNFFSRIYALLCRVYTFSFELFVLIFKFLGYFVKNDFFGVKIDKILFSWKSLEIKSQIVIIIVNNSFVFELFRITSFVFVFLLFLLLIFHKLFAQIKIYSSMGSDEFDIIQCIVGNWISS